MLFTGMGWLAVGTLPTPAAAGSKTMEAIYTAEWYQMRSEREQEWRGVLYERDTPAGPSSRGALRYNLETSAGVLAVYDPEESPTLAGLVGRNVIARGKLVDLTAEGFGRELWIGEIGLTQPLGCQ